MDHDLKIFELNLYMEINIREENSSPSGSQLGKLL